MGSTKEVTIKRLIFAREYVVDGNGRRAAVAAGYAEKSAHVAANKLLKHADVIAEIDRLKSVQAKRLDITADKVINEIARIAFQDMTEIVALKDGRITVADFENLTPDQRACIASAKQDKDGFIELKLYDKLNALEKLGKHFKLFTDMSETRMNVTQMGRVMIGDENATDGKAAPMTFNVGRDPKNPMS